MNNTLEREMRLPLSAPQLGVWFAQKIDRANPIYNIGQMIEIHGPVDPSLFNAAVTQAVIDTEALRVRLVEEIDSPCQLIGSPSEISIPLLDVSAELDPQAAAEAWMKADLAKPVDLLRGPLFHFALFKAAPARFFWYQRYHHVLIDGFGVVLFKRRGGGHLHRAGEQSALRWESFWLACRASGGGCILSRIGAFRS